jgi:hypothetical protein
VSKRPICFLLSLFCNPFFPAEEVRALGVWQFSSRKMGGGRLTGRCRGRMICAIFPK